MSKIQVKSVEKSSRWGKEDIRGNVRFFAVVRFTKADNKYSYPLSYDLAGIYGNDEQCQDESGKYDAEKAFEQFTKDARGEEILEGLNLYEIALPFAVKVPNKVGARPFEIQRQAFYGTEKEAQEYVIRALNRDLANGRLVRVDLEKDDAGAICNPQEFTTAILMRVDAGEYKYDMPRHSIRMYFVESLESEELYTFETNIERQFCSKEEYDVEEGISPQLFQEKVGYAKTLIGKAFEVNLFKFTVKELTSNRYVAFEYMTGYTNQTVKEYRIASYMTKEDVVLRMKYIKTLQAYQGDLYGVLPDGTREEIARDFFFSKPTPEKKHFDIPYENFPNLNDRFIVNEASINEIRNGHYLAITIKEHNISESDFNTFLDQIDDYRSKVRATKAANESIRKKIFFWESKEVVEELKLNPNVISMCIDSIILDRLYHNDCTEAKKAYQAECERKLREKFMHEDVGKRDFRKKFTEFSKSMANKYKGKEKIKGSVSFSVSRVVAPSL